jgi:hypothetical protein
MGVTDVDKPNDAPSSDFVIIGAGPSCMGLLFGLLSRYKEEENVPFSITVIDPGIGDDDDDDDPDNHVRQSPHRWFRAALDYADIIHSGVAFNNRVIDIPIGSGRGGTSRINATLCIPPRRQDFEDWPEPWKSNIMQSVAQIQRVLYSNSSLHIGISPSFTGMEPNESLPNPYIPMNDDPISWKETVFPSVAHHIPCTVHPQSLTRRNYYTGLLKPLLTKYSHLAQRITWVRGRVDKLLFQKQRVIGVEYINAKREAGSRFRRTIFALREVILSAGAIESPALLLSCGIGLAQDVEKERFPNYPGAVGRKLRDHVMLPRAIFVANKTVNSSLNGVQSLYHFCAGKGLFQVAVMDSVAYPDTLPHLVAGLLRYRFRGGCSGAVLWTHLSSLFFSLVKIMLVVLLAFPPIEYIMRYRVCVVTTFHLNPPATGQVRVRRKPGTTASDSLSRSECHLNVDLCYAESMQCIETMMDGWIATDVFCPKGLEVFPGPLIRHMCTKTVNKVRFQQFARAACLPYFHWCGTCSMKTGNGDKDWVVDSALRLRNVDGLRICDASVFPTAVSAPTALTCSAIGHTLGSILLMNNPSDTTYQL